MRELSPALLPYMDTPWFNMPVAQDGLGEDQRLASAVIRTVKDIQNRQAAIHEGHRRHARIYCGYLPTSLMWEIGRAHV